MKIEIYRTIQDKIVPTEVKMVAGILKVLGIDSQASPTSFLMTKGEEKVGVTISWNCIGWQSLILFLITLVMGLQGPYKAYSKVKTIIIGFLGTLLVNIFRVTLVALIAYFFGRFPAVLFHDYGSTLLIVAWIFVFWWLSYSLILEQTEASH